MTILAIRITGDPVLHTVAEPVTVFDAELRQLVDDMYETMDAAPGVGLAAPQVGVSKRLFVYDFDDEDGNPRRGVVINPILEISATPTGKPDEDTESEGCLSVPGERFPLRRAETAVIQGIDLDQKPIRIEASGWFARIFQHEFDHLDGKLYVDRLNKTWSREAKMVLLENGWGQPGKSWLPGRDNLEG